MIQELSPDELAEEARMEMHKRHMQELKANRTRQPVIDDSADDEETVGDDQYDLAEENKMLEVVCHFSQHSSICLRDVDIPSSSSSPDIGLTLDAIKRQNSSRFGMQWLVPTDEDEEQLINIPVELEENSPDMLSTDDAVLIEPNY